MDCLGSETIALYVTGGLAASSRARVDEHADACAECRRLIARVARMATDGRTTSTDDEIVPLGVDEIGRYRVLGVLGFGAMGVVVRAHDPELGRDVAIKILRPRAVDGPAIPTLLDEARAMALVEHPNVVAVYDVGSDGDRIHVAMELVRGGTLRGWWANAKRSWREIATVMAQAGLGLAAAHHAGLIHRDFKPENVLVADDGRVLVGDFGLATIAVERLTDSDRSADDGRDDAMSSRARVLAGTPAYMAPELLAGATPSAASDQYAFCVTFFEMLFGKRPSAGADVPRTGDLPARLSRLIERGLRANAKSRFPSMTALLADLDRVLDPSRRALWIAGVGSALAVAGVAWGLAAREPEQPPCDLADASLVDALGEPRRAAITAALARVSPSTPIPIAMVRDRLDGLDGWARQWSEQAARACESRASDPPAFAARRRCLLDRHEETTALLAVFDGADDAAIEAAAVRMLELEPPDCTGTVEPSAVPDALRSALAELRVLNWTARYPQAQIAALELVSASASVGDAAFQAAVAAELGRAQLGQGELAAALATLEQATLDARAAGADELEARAGVMLVMTMAMAGEIDRTDDWLRHLEAAADRMDRPMARAAVAYAGGAVAHRRREFAKARVLYERAIAEYESVLGPDTIAVYETLDALGRLEYDDGHPDRALPMLERALAIGESVWGPDHPEVANVVINMTPILLATGQAARARTLLERVLSGQQARLGPHNSDLGMTHMQLGLVALTVGDMEQGTKHLEACVAVHRTHPGSNAALVCRLNLAQALTVKPDCDAALVHYRGLADAYAAAASEHEFDREIVIVLLGEAGCELAKDPRRTEALLDRLEPLAVGMDDPTLPAEVKFLRARAKAALGHGREALVLARAARESLAAMAGSAVDPEVVQVGSEGALAQQIDEWIAAQAGARR